MIDVAEKTALIHDIENWVLNRAMNNLLSFKQIINQHITVGVTMAVNMSGIHMSEAVLGKYVFSLLTQYNLEPSDLTIELAENVLLTNIDSPTLLATK